ncbi:MAG: XRE family transcriptional regulator [Nitrosopumilales archaeon]|nr:MAG: XRE family transcriptional regulator [Nitrosopumilales archaeon]RPJ31561.1 MAG: XRE family transcriptional regulator [Nitrosopumilales archaeon]
MELKDRILRFRAKKKMSQQQLADLIGIHRTTLSALENNSEKCKQTTILTVEIFLEERGC